MHSFKTLLALLALSLAITVQAKERVLILNEGIWQSDNGSLSYFDNGKVVSNHWFRDINGYKLGDTPNDIIAVNNNLIAIAINWSNIVQFMRPDGHAVAATEDVPNNRKLASDGNYVYVTSYGHECRVGGNYRTFTKGFVAKIDVSTFKVVAACEVGWEPEGIALYQGKLFVANTGGYAFQEDHEYEKTVSVVNAATMTVERTINTGQINLCGKMSQSGQYLCVGSPGDYYEVEAATIILDCNAVLQGKPDSQCFVKLPFAASATCTTPTGDFYAIGSRYSFFTSEYEFDYKIINPAQVISTNGRSGVSENFPGTVLADIKKIGMPYGIYVNPYTGYIYATDAASFAEGGSLYQWTPQGQKQGTWGLYINPGHFLALDADGSGVDAITVEAEAGNGIIYNLLGQPVEQPEPGQIYIRNGKKFIYLNR